MIYKPEKSLLWDAWIVPHNNKYYLFHLSVSADMIGKSSWNGISLAISDDLVHWKEYGEVLKKRDNALWIGTGMIQNFGDHFIMNFSEECPAGVQKIYFAKSTDLIHWERIEDAECAPDGINYMNSSNDLSQAYPRWDSLGIVDALENKKPPYYAFLTASAKKTEFMNKNGGLGLLTSNDGLHWKCLPNAFPDTNMFPQFEVPEHFEINGRHYVTFCTSSYLSHRFDKLANDMSGGTFYVVSDNLLGPYRLPVGDYMLQGTRDHEIVSIVTVGRPLKVNNEWYYYHIWSNYSYHGAIGTVKLLREVEPYKLILLYNEINNSLYGKKLNDDSYFKEYKFIKEYLINPPCIIDTNKGFRFSSLGTSAAIDFKPLNGVEKCAYDDLSDGRIIDISLELESGCFGFYFMSEDQKERYCFAINKDRSRIEFGRIDLGWGPNVVLKDEIAKNIGIYRDFDVKIIVRHEYIEVYINNIYVSSWVTKQRISPNKTGLYLEEANGKIKTINIFQMK